MKSLFTYLKNVRAELEHVVWPKPRTAATHTLLIILLSVTFGLLIAGLDYVFTNMVGLFVR